MQTTMSVKQAADYLGVSRKTIGRMILNRQLQAEQNPMDKRHKVLKVSQLDRWKQYAEGLEKKQGRAGE